MVELVKGLPLNHKDLSSYRQDPCKPERQGRLHKVSIWEVQAVGFQKGLGSTSCSPSHKTRWGSYRRTSNAGLWPSYAPTWHIYMYAYTWVPTHMNLSTHVHKENLHLHSLPSFSEMFEKANVTTVKCLRKQMLQ